MRALPIPLLLACACAPELELGPTEVREVCVAADTVPFDSEGRARAPLTLGDDELSASAAVTMSSLELMSPAGVPDLSFVRRARVTVGGEPPLPEQVLVDAEIVGVTDALRVEPAQPYDVAAYVRSQTAALELAVAGDAPSDRWSADLVVCFAIEGVPVGEP